MNKKVLVIGTYFAEGVDSVDWSQELPYIPDYDVIILDTTRIFHYWYMGRRLEELTGNEYLLSGIDDTDRKIKQNLFTVRQKLIEMFEFDISVFVLYMPEVSICLKSGTNVRPFISTDNWCPISLDVVKEKGTRIFIKDESYKEYFTSFSGWEYYFVPESIGTQNIETFYLPKYKVEIVLETIAENRIKRPIAIKIQPIFFSWMDKKHNQYNVMSGSRYGSLALLPTPNIFDTAAFIEILLKRSREVKLEEAPRPTWVGEIEIPGEVPLKTQIEKESQKLKETKAKVGKLEASLTELEEHKRLLYADGLELQDICKSTLESVGVKTKPSPVSDEFMIEVEGKEALIEVKGSVGNINKADIGQLITDLGQLITKVKESKHAKGLLIGNAWRREPLGNRGKGHKPLFTRDVREIAESQNIGLLPTMELFKAYCRFLEEPGCQSEILDKIINSKGIICF